MLASGFNGFFPDGEGKTAFASGKKHVFPDGAHQL